MTNSTKILGVAALVGIMGAATASAAVLETRTSTVNSTTLGLKLGTFTATQIRERFAQFSSTATATNYSPKVFTVSYSSKSAGVDPVTGNPIVDKTNIQVATGALTNNPDGCVLSAPDDGNFQDINLSAGDPLGCGYGSTSPQTASTILTLNSNGQATNTATGLIVSKMPFALTVGGALGSGSHLSQSNGDGSGTAVLNEVTIDPRGTVVTAESAPGAGDGVFHSKVTKMDFDLLQKMDIDTKNYPVAGGTTVTAKGRQEFRVKYSLLSAFGAGIGANPDTNGGDNNKSFAFTTNLTQSVESTGAIDGCLSWDASCSTAINEGDRFINDMSINGGVATNLPIRLIPPGF